MDKQSVYRKIREIAHQLQKDGAIYTRADLAYDLQQSGVPEDGFEVGRLVWEAYRHFNSDAAIKAVFYDNDRKQPLVEEYKVNGLIEAGNADELFPLLQDRLSEGNRSLDALEHSIRRSLNKNIVQAGTGILNAVTGTQGVVKVRNEAAAVFDGYSQLVGNYDDAKSQIKYLIADFVKLRSYVCDIYRQYAMVLTDAFGDSVKAVSPELFDFDTIEWLDVQGMLQSVKLDYDRIADKCSLLMSDITESFSQSLKSAGTSYRSAGNKQVGLLLAGLNMITHYMDAGEKTAQLKQELLLLKNSVKHDVTLIKGDLGRLLVIYKSLNDLYIPQSEVFCRFSKQVLSAEWQQLEAALYADPAISTLKKERDGILAEYKDVEKEMADAEMNIAYYSSHIVECKQLLDSMQPQYAQARSTKPSKPFFLLNLLTLGMSGKRYNRDIYEWNMACAPVVSRYEDLQVDVKLDNDELKLHQDSLKKNRLRHRRLQQKLNRRNKLIKERICVNPSVRLQMLSHLEAIIGLLRMGREIAESKLDSKLAKTVSIIRQNTAVPAEVQQNISRLAQLVREQADVDAETVNEVLNQSGIGQCNAEDLAQVAASGNDAIRQTLNLLEAWTHLQAMQANSALADQSYDRELERLQKEFRRSLDAIDDKAAVLEESMRRIHTAENYEQLKEGMLSLAGKGRNAMDAKDWEDFLNGNKIIEL